MTDETVKDLFKRIVEDAVVTKTELRESIHNNTRELLAEFNARIDKQNEEMNRQTKVQVDRIDQYRREMRNDFKWFAGLIISVITVAVTAAN